VRELKIIDADIQQVKLGEYVLLPIADETRGHGMHSLPAILGSERKALLQRSCG
jgi:homoserine O-acetyltransferase